MKQMIFAAVILMLLILPVQAMELTAPAAPSEQESLMPPEPDTFAGGVLYILRQAFPVVQPAVTEASGTCLILIATVLMLRIVSTLPGTSLTAVHLLGAVSTATILLRPSHSLMSLASETVTQISHYGKLLLPVMAASLAAQGGATASSALYMSTAFFDALLSALINRLIVPMVYLFLCLSTANCATGEDVLGKFRDFFKWLMTWSLKTVLYIFTGFVSITGVVSGNADAAALKAAKLTISGVVPVVGGILSDASEAVLVSAGMMKNAAGIYGILAITAILITPFLKIGIQYLLLKLTAAVCAVFNQKRISALIQDFSGAMGMMLAITGAVSLMFLISTICFMKGVG